MKLQANSKIYRVQVIALNILTILFSVAAFFVSGGFFIPFTAMVIVFNLAWYLFIYSKRRVIAIEINEDSKTLKLIFNKSTENREGDLTKAELRYEHRSDQERADYVVLMIYEGGQSIAEIRPGHSGFSKGELDSLFDYFDKLTREKE